MAQDPKKLKSFMKHRGGGVKTAPDDEDDEHDKNPFHAKDTESDKGGGDDGEEKEKSDPGTDMSKMHDGGDDEESTPADEESTPGGDDDSEESDPGEESDDDSGDNGGDGEESGDVMAKVGDLPDLLRENADMLTQIVDEAGDLPHDDSAELAGDVKGKLKGELNSMPDALRAGLKKLKKLDMSDAKDLAGKLADEGKVDDAERFGAWLYWAGQAA